MTARLSLFVSSRLQDPATPSKLAIVNLPGMGTQVELQRVHLLELDAKYGDLFWPIYPSIRWFPARRIVSELADAVIGYEGLCINASSKGALVACDLIDELRRRGYKGKIKVIFVHPCTRRGIRLIPWRLATKPILEAGVEGSPAYARHKKYLASQTLKRSYWPQLAYILRHRPPTPGRYKDVEALIVEPTSKDPLLKRSSARPFELAFSSTVVVVENVGHSDFVEQPKRWRQVFEGMYSRFFGAR